MARRRRVRGPRRDDRRMRVVALGASNLTRGLHALVELSRAAWGPGTRVLAALGHGRSYGDRSRFLFRSLPGILDCGLWPALAAAGPGETRALVTDVGNDILYGRTPEQVLAWVGACVDRLQQVTTDIALTDLPLAGIRRLTPLRYLFFRTLFVPSCRLSLEEAQQRSEQLARGLAEVAERRALRLVRLRPEWYGLDPIHIRPALWSSAWSEIAGCPAAPAGRHGSRRQALRVYCAQPERMTLLGVERRHRQPALPGLELY